jgi:hypothetical protein
MEHVAAPQVKFGEWISEGWKMFTEQWKGWVLNTFIFYLVAFLPFTIAYLFFYLSFFLSLQASARSSRRTPVAPEFPIVFLVIFPVIGLFTLLASSFFLAGMHRSALKQLRGGTIVVRDLFSGGKDFLPVLGALFLGGILTSIGMLLCIIPGFIVAGAIFFTIPLILDRNLGVIQAMQTSYELVKKNLLMFTLFVFVVQLIAQAGAYACGIGILATIPLLFTITAVAYRDCFGMEGARRFLPQAPPSPSGYGQPMENIYQPPPYGQGGFNPPPFGQGGFNPPPQSYNPPPPPNFNPPPPEPPNFAPPQMPPSGEVTKPASTEQIPKPPTPTSAEPPGPQNQGITCANCGASLPSTAVFCPRCGTRTKP